VRCLFTYSISLLSGQLFTRSCIPGSVDKAYNPTQYPVSLCEACGAGGGKKCRRNSDEQYYGATGAFRCLVECELRYEKNPWSSFKQWLFKKKGKVDEYY